MPNPDAVALDAVALNVMAVKAVVLGTDDVYTDTQAFILIRRLSMI